MHTFDNNQGEDHSIFKKQYSNDPFRDGNYIFFEEENLPVFSLGEDKSHPEDIKSDIKSKLKENVSTDEPAEPKEPLLEIPVQEQKVVSDSDIFLGEYTNGGPKRTAGAVVKSGLRQVGIYAMALVIVVFALNASAYYKIIKNEFEKFFGLKEESPLMELVEEESDIPEIPTIAAETYNKTVLKTGATPQDQSQYIPPLDIEIFPVDNRLVIPRIDQNIPIIRVSSENLIKRDWNALENDLQDALQDGVVHYPGTSLPGQSGNVVITGHSSYFPWDAGRFKDVFALLHDVVIGDKILVYHEQKKYIYEIADIQVVMPQDIKVLQQTEDDQITLITCTPVGTNLKRLIVIGKLIEDHPVENSTTKVQRG